MKDTKLLLTDCVTSGLTQIIKWGISPALAPFRFLVARVKSVKVSCIISFIKESTSTNFSLTLVERSKSERYLYNKTAHNILFPTNFNES